MTFTYATMPMSLAYPYAARLSVLARTGASGGSIGTPKEGALEDLRFTPAHVYALDMACAAYYAFTMDNKFGRGRVDPDSGSMGRLVLTLTKHELHCLLGGVMVSKRGRARSGAGDALRLAKRALATVFSGKAQPLRFGVTYKTQTSPEGPKRNLQVGTAIDFSSNGDKVSLCLSLKAFPLEWDSDKDAWKVTGQYICLPAGFGVLLGSGLQEGVTDKEKRGRVSTVSAHRLMVALQAFHEKKVFGRGLHKRKSSNLETISMGPDFIKEHRPSVIRQDGRICFKAFAGFVNQVVEGYKQGLGLSFRASNPPKGWILPTLKSDSLASTCPVSSLLTVARDLGDRPRPGKVPKVIQPQTEGVAAAVEALEPAPEGAA